ncbi:MAG TPA: thymidine kinase [Lachnospiraceae bacterium]|nr:thymidine kinase [Lachnospiraceae bacterium]
MAKLYFRYGAMGSSKTANALMVRYNYEEKGQYAVILKPRLDNRDGAKTVYSRIGLQAEGEFVETFLEKVKREWMPCLQDGVLTAEKGDWNRYAAVIVDEAQFLTADQADLLSELVDYFDIPVICYGLRTDFRGMLFEGSRRLLEIADRIEEIPTVCWCGRRAHFNARFSDGKILRTGEQIFLGANESYVSLCRKHYKEGKLREE